MDRCKKLLTFGAVIFFLLLSQAAYAKKSYTKDQLFEMGGKSISGTVEKVGTYNFHIRTANKEQVNIHTDAKKIQFSPKDERLMVGDKVEVIYISPENASRSTDKKLAYYVGFMEKVPREFLTEEMICIFSLSSRSGKACYLPEHDRVIDFEGYWPIDERSPSPGKKYKVWMKTVPANIGNGYIYKIRKAESF